MKRVFSHLIVALLLVMLAAAARATEPWVSFRHVGIGQGLSNSTVQSIAQDSLGYIWVATHDGLNRYDGNSFKIYRSDSADDASLPENVIKRVFCDVRGNLWVISAGNLTRYDHRLDSFEAQPLPDGDSSGFNTAVALDSATLLVGTAHHLYKFHIDRREFTQLATAPVSAIAVSGNRYFIGGQSGLSVLLPAESEPRTIAAISAPVNALHADGKNLWIATEGSGVWLHDIASGATSRLAVELPSPFVRSLATDSNRKLWIGTVDGLSVYTPADRSLRTFTAKTDESGATPLSHSSVRSIFADKRGGIWIGTWFGGLNYYHPLQNRFRNIGVPPLTDGVVSCIVPWGNYLYIGTNAGGLNILDRVSGRVKTLTRADGLGASDVKAVYVDSLNRHLYVGAHLGGLSVFDLTTLRLIYNVGTPAKVYSILPASGGRLWLGSLDGLYLFTPEKRSAVPVMAPVTNITDIYRDSKGRLWLSGELGLAICSEGADAEIFPMILPQEIAELSRLYINNVYELPSTGEFFISTRHGLWVLDENLNLKNHYTTASGLPNDIVLGVLADNEGNLWISTNIGLTELNPHDGTIRNYGLTDYQGVRQFNAKSLASVNGQRLYFGGIGGIIAFSPSEITTDSITERPLINGVRVFGNPVSPGDGSGVLTSTVETGSRITLHPGQSMVTFDFTACNFHNNVNGMFSYRLVGVDPDWIDAGTDRSATYRNLPPGLYRFEVRASGSDNLWSSARSVEVRVMPSWYQQWWAQLIGIILAGVAAWLLIRRFTLRRLREQQREYEKRDYERRQALNDMKINFFVNMSHELRTPLTLILLPVTELIEQKRSEPKVLDKLRTIRGNTLRILNVINQILDYQRAENGMFPLKVRPVDVNTMLADELANYSARASHDNIDCRMDSTVDNQGLPLDPNYLSIIIGNLLSNAFKHTPAGKSVRISVDLTPDGKSLVIKVTDTGYGIDPVKLPHIFDRFYKVDENSYGSGIGLSLVKRLVDLHHGSITVDSAPDRGTSFTVTLPAEESAYPPDERAAGPDDDGEMPQPHLPSMQSYVEPPGPDVADDSAEPADDAERQTIMLVDDNDTILKYMREALAGKYRIIMAHDGTEALKLLDEETPDMVITDLMMPRTDGLQLCRAIKRNIRTSHIPVMMLSAKSDVRDQLDAMKVGADDYLPKPFSMPLLVAKIANRFRTRASTIRFYADTPNLEPVKMAMNPLDEEFLSNAVKTVEQHIDDSEFTTDGFARAMLMSRSNLHLKLKALTGESSNEFIRRIRMNRALELLKSGRYTVAEVSAMVGYGTPSYFSTSFKKFFGAQPSDHIKN